MLPNSFAEAVNEGNKVLVDALIDHGAELQSLESVGVHTEKSHLAPLTRIHSTAPSPEWQQELESAR
jgi:hypothetical protein